MVEAKHADAGLLPAMKCTPVNTTSEDSVYTKPPQANAVPLAKVTPLNATSDESEMKNKPPVYAANPLEMNDALVMLVMWTFVFPVIDMLVVKIRFVSTLMSVKDRLTASWS